MAKRGRRGYIIATDGAGGTRVKRRPASGDPSYQPFLSGVLGDLCFSDEEWKSYRQHEKKFGPLLALRTMAQMLADLRLLITEKNTFTIPRTGKKVHIDAGWGPKARDWSIRTAEVGYLLELAEELSRRVEDLRRRLREDPDARLFCECGCAASPHPGSNYVDDYHAKRHRDLLSRLNTRARGDNPWLKNVRKSRRNRRRAK